MGREVCMWHWGLSVATGPQRVGVGDGGAPLLPNPSTELREHVPPALCVEFLSFPVPPPRNLGIGEEQQGRSACAAILRPMLDACTYTHAIYIHTYMCPHTLHTHTHTHVYPHSIYMYTHIIYIYVYTHAHTLYMHIHMCTHYICAYARTYIIYMHTHVHTLYVHIHIYTHYMYAHTCTHITYICVCIHIHTHIFPPQTFFQLSPSVVVSPWMFCMIILSFIINFDNLSFFRCLF